LLSCPCLLPEPDSRADLALCMRQICKADIAGPEEGESKPDGKVDVHDLLKVLSGYSKQHETRHAADIDNNMLVDVTDLLYILKHYDKECPQQKRGFFGR